MNTKKATYTEQSIYLHSHPLFHNWKVNKSKLTYDSGLDKRTPIVCYCAVGLRSGWLALKLYRKGFREARALDGGILDE